jgi:hypothetical protein
VVSTQSTTRYKIRIFFFFFFFLRGDGKLIRDTKNDGKKNKEKDDIIHHS